MDVLDSLYHTPLFHACAMGHTEVVVTLLNAGASVDFVDADGRAPLHWYVLVLHVTVHFTYITANLQSNSVTL